MSSLRNNLNILSDIVPIVMRIFVFAIWNIRKCSTLTTPERAEGGGGAAHTEAFLTRELVGTTWINLKHPPTWIYTWPVLCLCFQNILMISQAVSFMSWFQSPISTTSLFSPILQPWSTNDGSNWPHWKFRLSEKKTRKWMKMPSYLSNICIIIKFGLMWVMK